MPSLVSCLCRAAAIKRAGVRVAMTTNTDPFFSAAQQQALAKGLATVVAPAAHAGHCDMLYYDGASCLVADMHAFFSPRGAM